MQPSALIPQIAIVSLQAQEAEGRGAAPLHGEEALPILTAGIPCRARALQLPAQEFEGRGVLVGVQVGAAP
jgi:hypothetical protein